MEEAQSEGQSQSAELQEQLVAVQNKGPQQAFQELDADSQSSFLDVSLMELAAFVAFRREWDGLIGEDAEQEWDGLDRDAKIDWVPKDALAFLKQDERWNTFCCIVLPAQYSAGRQVSS